MLLRHLTPFTPSPQIPSLQTASQTQSVEEKHTPTLTELVYPYITIEPEPPKFQQIDEENSYLQYLRQRVAELTYTNEALTDGLVTIELGKTTTYQERVF